MKYIVHPQTKEIEEARNFTVFNDWQKTQFEEFEGIEVISNDKVYIDSYGAIVACQSLEAYFEGKSFYYTA